MKNNLLILFSFLLTVYFSGSVLAQNNEKPTENTQTVEEVKPDVPAKILKTYPVKSAGNCYLERGEQVTTAIKMTLHESGKVTAAEIVRASKCKDYNENAMKAALKTEFEPAIKNGKPITVFKMIEASYSRH